MAYNKIITTKGETLIDLTQDTVTPETLLEGATAHAKNGEVITGTATGGSSANLIEGTFTENGTYEAEPNESGPKMFIDILDTFEESALGYIKKSKNFTIEDKENILANLEIYFSIPEELVSQVGTDKEIIATGPDFTLNEGGIPTNIAEVYTYEGIDLMFMFIKDADIFNAELSTNLVNGDMLYIAMNQNFLDELTQMKEQGISLKSALEKEAQPFDGWNKIIINIPAPPTGGLVWKNWQGIDYAMDETNLFLRCDGDMPDLPYAGYGTTIPWQKMNFDTVHVLPGTTSIGEHVLFTVKGKTLILPEGLTTIKESTYTPAPRFHTVYWPRTLVNSGDLIKDTILYGGSFTEWITNVSAEEKAKLKSEWNLQDRTISNNLSFPSGTQAIPTYACSDFSNVRTITIPDGVVLIGAGAFQNCVGLYEITIPASITTIDDFAFKNSGLKEIYFEEGSQLTEIKSRAFQYCYDLKNIEIPSSVTTIEYEAFKNCSQITELIIPSSVNTFRLRAYSGAIFDCGTLTKKATYYLLSTTPPTLEMIEGSLNSFLNKIFTTNTLNKIIVPAGCGDAYKTATGWSEYASYIEEAAE